MAAPIPRTDFWNRWFFRAVQVVGLGLGVHEQLGPARALALIFAGALILGAQGILWLVRGLGEFGKAAEREAERGRASLDE